MGKRTDKVLEGWLEEKIVREPVDGALAETGTDTRHKSDGNARGTVKGGTALYDGIKAVAVFSSRNPAPVGASRSFRKKGNHSLLESLKGSHYACVPVGCLWDGVPEPSFAVINISPEAAAWFCGRFRQARFIYSKVTDGTIETACYERQDTTKPYNRKTNPYIIKDSALGCVDMFGAGSDFTVVCNKFSYRIGYPTLSSVNETIYGNYTDELGRGERSLFYNRALDKEIDFTIHRVGQAPSIHRGRLYRGLI